jgi:hypothetical protein
MAFTTGSKRFASMVVIVAVLGSFYHFGKDNHYFGLTKPAAPVVVEQEKPQPEASVPTSVVERQEPAPVRQRIAQPTPVQEAPVQVEAEAEVAAPAPKSSAINKMKGMGSL